jgi:hypothetical protein
MAEKYFDEIGHPEMKKLFGETGTKKVKEVTAPKTETTKTESAKQEPEEVVEETKKPEPLKQPEKKNVVDEDFMSELGLESKPTTTPKVEESKSEASEPKKRKKKEDEPKPKVESKPEAKAEKTTEEKNLEDELADILNS